MCVITGEPNLSISNFEQIIGLECDIRVNKPVVMERLERQQRDKRFDFVTVLCVPKNNHDWEINESEEKLIRQIEVICAIQRKLVDSGFDVDWKIILGDVANITGLCIFDDSANAGSIETIGIVRGAFSTSRSIDVFDKKVPQSSAFHLVEKLTLMFPALDVNSFKITSAEDDLLLIADHFIRNNLQLLEKVFDLSICSLQGFEKLLLVARKFGLPEKFGVNDIEKIKLSDLSNALILFRASLELLGSARARAVVSLLFPPDSVLVTTQANEVDDFWHLLPSGDSFPTVSFLPDEILSRM